MKARSEIAIPRPAPQRRAKPLPFELPSEREAGVLLHVSSLPGPYGIGDLGPAAHAWIDQLAAAHQSWWQILPLSPPAAGHSPYQCYSAFAGNPLLISPEQLVTDGLLDRGDLKPMPGRTDRVHFERVTRTKTAYLRRAWANYRQSGGGSLRVEFNAFRERSADWLNDYALFTALRAAFDGALWTDWPTAISRRDPKALQQAREQHAEAIAFEEFSQFLFDRQLRRLRDHAYAHGVGILGDVPIFVSSDSADVWANPQLFQLDKRGHPKAVAGVPPDGFSATGQRWNNPLYDWAAMQQGGYAWWIARMKAALSQADAVRLDHFRGFDSYWRIPVTAATASTGRWIDGPGAALFERFRTELGGLPVIAEDLGIITDRIHALRDSLGLAGMRVIQFGLGDCSDSIHLPHRFVRNCVAYPGTHDNDTTVGWYRALRQRERRRMAHYAGHLSAVAEPSWALIRLAWASVAALAITPLQDVLSLPSKARMNTPGVGHGNWRWRANDQKAIDAGLERLAELTVTFARA